MNLFTLTQKAYAAFGLTNNKIPSSLAGTTEVEGINVVLHSAATMAESYPEMFRPHRLMAQCPNCEKWFGVGRLEQHRHIHTRYMMTFDGQPIAPHVSSPYAALTRNLTRLQAFRLQWRLHNHPELAGLPNEGLWKLSFRKDVTATQLWNCEEAIARMNKHLPKKLRTGKINYAAQAFGQEQ